VKAEFEIDGSEAILEALAAGRRRAMEGLSEAELNKRIDQLQREFARRTDCQEDLSG